MNPANSQEALGQLQQIQAQSQDPNSILSGQRQQLGVNDAQQTVTGLRGAINNTTKLLKQVAPSVMGRTGSSLVTNAQATRQIGNEQAPINQTLTDQGGQLTDADRTYNELNSQAQQAATGIYQGQQDKLSYAQNLYNTLYQKEQAAEAARRAELDRQEQIRQFNEQLAQSKASAAASGGKSFDLGSALAGATGKAPTVQDQAYQSVQRFLTGSDAQIKSDYAATLKSANYGNALDKLKVQLYQQSRPDLFGNKTKTVSASGVPGLSSTSKLSGVKF